MPFFGTASTRIAADYKLVRLNEFAMDRAARIWRFRTRLNDVLESLPRRRTVHDLQHLGRWTIRPAPKKEPTTTHTSTNLDGRKVAENTLHHVGKGGQRQPRSPRLPDNNTVRPAAV